MMRMLHVPLVLGALTLPAAAQDAARNFPLGKPFKVISISGFDVQKAGITLTITPELQSKGWVGDAESAQRWRIDDKNRLIIEGEAARLLLTAGGADKQQGKKPAK